VSLLADGELAVTQGVPQLNSSVAGSGDDLPVIGREGDGEDVVCVSNKSTSGGTGGKLPESESLVPRCREGICTVGGNNLKKFVSAGF
jgi:hypothetical protein